MTTKTKAIIFSTLLLAILTGGIAFFAVNMGLLWPTTPSIKDFPVRGVDVSHHQGKIDWERIEAQGMHFAYMKATEGGDFKDTEFAINWSNAQKTSLRIGAYHFFTVTADGLAQAQNFFDSVPQSDKTLPPMIDVECEIVDDQDKQAAIRKQLGILLREVEKHYGVKPVIYTTAEIYTVYVEPDFSDYPLWIRSIFGYPELPEGKDWVFWQYNPRGRLHGYQGTEKFIDLNVFRGSKEEFSRFGKVR